MSLSLGFLPFFGFFAVLVEPPLHAGTPDTTASPEPTLERYDALWLKEKPKETYPAYKVTARVSGRILTLDYKDGVGVCVEYNKKLGCRWVQLDSNGRTTLERKPSGTLEGRWGFGEDDSSQGTLRLTPAGATPEPKPKAKAKPKP